MLSKIQSLLDSDSISPDCRQVLENSKLQAHLLKALPDFREHPVFKRFVTEHDLFWKDGVKYPLSKYNELPIVEDITEIGDDSFFDYELGIYCKFTWRSCDYEEERFYIKFLASWLTVKEDESPWMGSFVREMIYECKVMLSNSDYLTKNKKDKNSELANLIGVSEKSLQDWSQGKDSSKINRLKNLHLFLRIVTNSRNYKDSIPDSFIFLVNSRYVWDEAEQDDEFRSSSFIAYINSLESHCGLVEMTDAINKTIKDEKEQQKLEEEYAMYQKLEKKFKKG